MKRKVEECKSKASKREKSAARSSEIDRRIKYDISRMRTGERGERERDGAMERQTHTQTEREKDAL